jgi:hypothetical protein
VPGDRQPVSQDDRVRWPARLCGGKDDQGPQTAHSDRYDRPAGRDVVTPAKVQDRDAAPDLLASLGNAFPWLHHIFADGGYAGPKLQDALNNLRN